MLHLVINSERCCATLFDFFLFTAFRTGYAGCQQDTRRFLTNHTVECVPNLCRVRALYSASLRVLRAAHVCNDNTDCHHFSIWHTTLLHLQIETDGHFCTLARIAPSVYVWARQYRQARSAQPSILGSHCFCRLTRYVCTYSLVRSCVQQLHTVAVLYSDDHQ